jgi:hypothetical protein
MSTTKGSPQYTLLFLLTLLAFLNFLNSLINFSFWIFLVLWVFFASVNGTEELRCVCLGGGQRQTGQSERASKAAPKEQDRAQAVGKYIFSAQPIVIGFRTPIMPLLLHCVHCGVLLWTTAALEKGRR